MDHSDQQVKEPAIPFQPFVYSVVEPGASNLPTLSIPTPRLAFSGGFVRINQRENIDGPEHKFQVNEYLLYEREFHGDCYVSAHLQRLQHGVFGDSNIHGETILHVTFVAVTFVFHPVKSLSHRFQSAIIEINARSDTNETLRFVKFAPHLAFGRISTETLKWNFQLGASLGVTKGPAQIALNPSVGYEKGKVLGTMLKIQGSTRSRLILEDHKTKTFPDTKLIWSLEENDQQEAGLPREFTFVFLIERPTKSQSLLKPLPKGDGPKQDNRDKDVSPDTAAYDHLNHAATFSPMHIGITVKPHISGVVDPLITEEWDETLIVGEVGQRLAVEHTNKGSSGDNVATSGYYNFAKMPGNFEDLVELPGNTVTSLEPNLP